MQLRCTERFEDYVREINFKTESAVFLVWMFHSLCKDKNSMALLTLSKELTLADHECSLKYFLGSMK